MKKNELSEFLHFTSWKSFTFYFVPLSVIPEKQFQMLVPENGPLYAGTLAAVIVQFEGLTRFVAQSLLGQIPDNRTDPMIFDAFRWATVTEADNKQTLLDALEQAYEELQHMILSRSAEQLFEHGRPMWQPGAMSSPLEAVLTLTSIMNYQKGHLSCLLKEFQ